MKPNHSLQAILWAIVGSAAVISVNAVAAALPHGDRAGDAIGLGGLALLTTGALVVPCWIQAWVLMRNVESRSRASIASAAVLVLLPPVVFVIICLLMEVIYGPI